MRIGFFTLTVIEVGILCYLFFNHHRIWGLSILALILFVYVVALIFTRLRYRQVMIQKEVISFLLAFREFEKLHLSEIPKGSPVWFDGLQEFERRIEMKPESWKQGLQKMKEDARLEFEESLHTEI
ncbi:hypothetical protein ACOALA_20775 (plasmid) [Alicyclobacillus acidoterrestris]|uniref:hypothetical protein n=1 Tax=Alicyclobacillus acidoterrestris TaxID=1450 RepID=UPI003F53CCCB